MACFLQQMQRVAAAVNAANAALPKDQQEEEIQLQDHIFWIPGHNHYTEEHHKLLQRVAFQVLGIKVSDGKV